MVLAISGKASPFVLRQLSLLCIRVVLNPRSGPYRSKPVGELGLDWVDWGHCRVKMRSVLIANPKGNYR
jgi:hypothetical protein